MDDGVRVRAWAALAAGLLLAACGTEGPSSADGGHTGMDGSASPDAGGAGSDAGAIPESVSEADAPGVLASAWCALQEECGCNAIDPDEATCVLRVTDQTQRHFDAARSAGLTYDPVCAGRILRIMALRGCSTWGYWAEVGCEACPLWYGDTPDGEPCEENMVDATPCGRNRQCLLVDSGDTFLCGDPCAMTARRIVGIGEACDPRDQIVCDDAEATCGASGTCEPLPSAGEPCDDSDCDRNAYCDDTDTCVPVHPRSGSCTDGFECETAVCDMGVCQPGCQLQPF